MWVQIDIKCGVVGKMSLNQRLWRGNKMTLALSIVYSGMPCWHI